MPQKQNPSFYRLHFSLAWVPLLMFLSWGDPALAQQVRANGLAVDVETQNPENLAALLADAGEARVVHLAGDPPEHPELFHQARLRLIQLLHREAGFDVLVLPVGIYEGVWADRRLLDDTVSLQDASLPFYRVWRQSPAFLEILDFVRQTGDQTPRLEVIGGLSRFHAAGKQLYGGHLAELFQGIVSDQTLSSIEELLAGRGRLTSKTAEFRRQALELVDGLLSAGGDVGTRLRERLGARELLLEHHVIVNMRTFIELEQIRAGDLEDDGTFATREKSRNLQWFLERYYPDRKLIYWEGRGASDDPLPTTVSVFRIDLSLGD